MKESIIRNNCRRVIKKKLNELKAGEFNIDTLSHYLQNKCIKIKKEKDTIYKEIFIQESQRMITLVYKTKKVSKSLLISNNRKKWKLLDILERFEI